MLKSRKPVAGSGEPEGAAYSRSSFRRRPESSFCVCEHLDPGLRRDDGRALDPMSGYRLPATGYRSPPRI